MSIRIDASGDDLRRTASLPDESAFTICGWAYAVSDRGVAVYQGLAALEGVGAGTYNGLYWEGSTDGAMRVESGAGGANFASRPAVGTWFFWALTSTTAGAGSLIGYWSAATSSTFNTASTTGQASTPDRLTIGNDSVSSWFDGRLAAIKIWDAVLTQAELEAEKWRTVPWRFQNIHLWNPGGPASDLADYSGNGRTLTATGTLTTEDGPPIAWGFSRARVPVVVSAGQTIAIGQALETDTAQPIAWAPKRRLVGQVTETDLAQGIARLKTRAIGQVLETDLAQPVSWAPKNRLVGQVIEIDLAQPITVVGSAPTIAGADYTLRTKRRRIVLDGKQYLLTPQEEADLLNSLIARLEREKDRIEAPTQRLEAKRSRPPKRVREEVKRIDEKIDRYKIHLALLRDRELELDQSIRSRLIAIQQLEEEEALAFILALA